MITALILSAILCDGVTNDLPEIKTALAAGDVKLPAGVCVVDSSFVVPAGRTLTGAGWNATTVKHIYSQGRDPSVVSLRERSVIRDVTVDGGFTPRNEDLGGIAIAMDASASYARVERVRVQNAQHIGVLMYGVDQVVTDSEILGSGTGGVGSYVGFVVDKPTCLRPTITNNLISGWYLNAIMEGKDATGMIVQGNRFERNHLYYASGTGGAHIFALGKQSLITDNWIGVGNGKTTQGIELGGTGTTTATGIVANNIIVQPMTGAWAGCIMIGASNSIITGNLCSGYTVGLFVYKSQPVAPTNNVVVGNNVVGNQYAWQNPSNYSLTGWKMTGNSSGVPIK